jgi:type IV pilus assembly protein PilA
MRMQTGFTLIELMIVISIIGVLAAIAIPQYQDYVIRSKVTEGLSMAGQAEIAVAEKFQSLGHMPIGNNSSFDLPSSSSMSGKYVQSIAVTGGSGKITITYGNLGSGLATGLFLTLTPGTSPEAAIAWACGYSTVTVNGNTVGGPTAGSTVPPKYLPLSCRG